MPFRQPAREPLRTLEDHLVLEHLAQRPGQPLGGELRAADLRRAETERRDTLAPDYPAGIANAALRGACQSNSPEAAAA
jgi:hypothetical protein